ncbi:MAG: VanZ family protein [Fidelibacterota bacterium]|nr:MAG: VanZ family protein [Candidatus Neomarinimicrobiota bacterium]
MRLPVLGVFLYALLIIGLSSIPGHSFPDVKWLSHDKVIHLGEYMIFGFLVSAARVSYRPDVRRLYPSTLVLAGAFAALDEAYQFVIPGRLPSLRDWVADFVGVAIGGLIYMVWKYYRAQATAG